MLNQEEIRIKAGLDYSKVTAGLTDIRGQVFKLANDVPKQLGNLLKANVFAAAAQIGSEALAPLKNRFLDVVFGIGPDVEKRLGEYAASMEEFVKQQEKKLDDLARAKKNFNKAARDEDYNRGSNLDKQAILESELETKYKEIAFLEEKVKRLKASGVPSANEQTALYNAETEAITMRGQLAELRKNFTPDDIKQDHKNKDAADVARVHHARQIIRQVLAQRELDFQDGNYQFADEYKNTIEDQRNIVGQAIHSRTSRAASFLPELPMFKGIKDYFEAGSSFQSRKDEFSRAQAEANAAALVSAINQKCINVIIKAID